MLRTIKALLLGLFLGTSGLAIILGIMYAYYWLDTNIDWSAIQSMCAIPTLIIVFLIGSYALGDWVVKEHFE
jgi:Kef-type K+ transport system membrane component KefB